MILKETLQFYPLGEDATIVTPVGDWLKVQGAGNDIAWCHKQTRRQNEANHYRLFIERFKTTTPLYFIFYMAGEEAMVGSERFTPGMLKKYQGPATSVICVHQGSKMRLEGKEKMQIIPLDGVNASFLVAYELESATHVDFIASQVLS